MNTPSTPELSDILDEITPKIDFALSEGSINEYLENPDLPADLQRRDCNCNPTSWLLSFVLRDMGIFAVPHLRTGSIAYRSEQIPIAHVVLKMPTGDNRIIDPTSQQYYRFVGLRPSSVINDPDLVNLYPNNRVAIIEPDENGFQDNFASIAHDVERRLTERGTKGGLLSGSTLDEKKNAYSQLWSADSYKSMFQPKRDLRRAITQSAIVADRYELLK
ncbi:MAG: hypothetical protein H6797_02600 [Candidatus Nomurabacteria bacterium]|nr:MAG: hypothetical protein H6797_02600 [Candidatus Nomurabacteria bacterium]